MRWQCPPPSEEEEEKEEEEEEDEEEEEEEREKEVSLNVFPPVATVALHIEAVQVLTATVKFYFHVIRWGW